MERALLSLSRSSSSRSLLSSLPFPSLACSPHAGSLTAGSAAAVVHIIRREKENGTGGNLFPFLVTESGKIHSIFRRGTFFTRIMIYFHDHRQGMSSRLDRVDEKASECVGNTPLHADCVFRLRISFSCGSLSLSLPARRLSCRSSLIIKPDSRAAFAPCCMCVHVCAMQ